MIPMNWLKSLSVAGFLGICLSPAVLALTAPPSSSSGSSAFLLSQAPLQAATEIRLTRDRFNIRIVNQSSAAISYVAAGDTPTRSLAKGAEVLLRDLRIPASLLFQSTTPSGDLRLYYSITVQPEGEANGLKIILRDGGVNDGKTSVFVDAVGKVFVD